MILIHSGGKVDKLDIDFDFTRFRLPVQMPCELNWIKESEVVTVCPPSFKYIEFEYVATVDDEPIYKEVKHDKI
jgi:hypothetical protein